MIILIRKLLTFLGSGQSEKIIKNIRLAINANIYHKKQVAEINKIDLEKWREGERLKRDPGEDFVFRWIDEYGKDFQEKFINSRCRACSGVYDCVSLFTQNCSCFTPELTKETAYIIKGLMSLLICEKIFRKDDEVVKILCSYYSIPLDSLED